MSNKKTIVIAGATGSQGGGLARTILNDPNSKFEVRALTRDVTSDTAKELQDMGAELVTADVGDKDSLIDAFRDAYGAYLVTFYWEHFSPEKEKQHAKNLAEAVKKADVEHVIWSTLEDTREWIPLSDDRMPTLMEKYKVPHFDAKGEADKFFENLPTTYLCASFYWDNMIHFGMGPQKGPDGTLAITLPLGDAKMPGIAAEDIGKCAYGIFKKGTNYIGKRVGVSGEHLSGQEMADELSDALGEKVKYNAVSADTYRGFDFPGADDLGNMFQYYRDFEEDFRKLRSVEESKKLNPELQSFSDWLDLKKDRIPIQ